MFSNTVTTFSRITAHWQLQLKSWNEFSRLLTESFLGTWHINLRLGEAILGGRVRPASAPGIIRAATFQPREPRYGLDSAEVHPQGLAQFATAMQVDLAPVEPARSPETVHAVLAPDAPGASGGAVHAEDMERAARDDEEWRLAEQAYLDTAGENMHAEGHVQTAAPATAAPPRAM